VKLSGVGIGLRRDFARQLPSVTRRVDWLEVVPENYLRMSGPSFATLKACRERWPIAFHGVSLSVCGTASTGPYTDALCRLMEQIEPAYVTDHLCLSELDGEPIFDLVPVPWSDAFVEHAAARARHARQALGVHVALENITNYAPMPGGNMTETAFVRSVLEASDTGLLLDINNLYLNAMNLRQDPMALLLGMPLDRVTQMHLAGHVDDGTRLLDTHNRKVADPVWSLYREALRHTGPVPVLIEWDQDIPSLDHVLDEADRAREILYEVTGSASPVAHAEAAP
jgi:uncharacterized protein